MAEIENPKKAHIIYPAYINKNRTVAKGRRVPLQNAIADPKPNEIVDALFSLKGFQAQCEIKPYCRELDKESVPWRIRYNNINLAKNQLQNKRQVLAACAKRIQEVRAKSGPTPNSSSEGSGKSKKKNK